MESLLAASVICPFCFAASDDQGGKLVACPTCKRPFLSVHLHKHETRGTTTGLSLPSGGRTASSEHETLDANASTPVDQALARDDLELGRGRYQCTEELGRGGMGVVVRARDRSLGRDVAVKLLKEPDRPGRLRRFLREAQVSGQLAHPNIVPVHDFGIDAAGRVYFTMQLIEGRTLGAHLDDLRDGRSGMPLGRLVRILVQVCNAIELAHSRDVIHRDLKPGNIMIGSFGEVLVMDWGLARVIEKSGEVSIDGTSGSSGSNDSDPQEMTQEGSVLGTPAYMPPEQAEGHNTSLDPRSDLYSLGAILYEMLTLRAPVVGRDIRDVLTQVRLGQIDLPSAVAPGNRPVPPDLEAVTMRALARSPADRYQRVSDLRRDLEAWLDGRAVSARSVPLNELLLMTFRRHRVGVLVAALVAAAGLGGLTLAIQVNRQARFFAEASQVEAETARAQSEAARLEAVEARVAVNRALDAERVQHGKADRERYLSSIALASQELAQDDYGAAVGALASCPAALRDWPWRRLDLLTRLDLLRRTDVADPGTSITTLPGGHVLATSRDGSVHLYGDGLRPEGSFQAHRSAVMTATLLNDGRVLSGGADGTLRLWKISAVEPDKIIVGAEGPITSVFTDGTLAWSITVDGHAHVWDLATARSLQNAEVGPGSALLHEGPDYVARRADGTGVAMASAWLHEVPAVATGQSPLAWNDAGWITRAGNQISLVTTAGGLTPLINVGEPPTAAVWSADGKRLAVLAGSAVTVITPGQGQPLRIAGHAGPVVGASFVEDGARLVTIGDDGSVRLWDAEKRRDVDIIPVTGPLAAGAISADGGRMLMTDQTGAAVLVDVRSRSVLRRWNAGFPISAAALSADGSLAALASSDGRARVCVVDSGYILVSLPKTKTAIRSLAFDPAMRRLAVAASDGRVRIHDLSDGHELYTCHGHSGAVPNLIFGTTHLRTGGVDGTVRTFTEHNGERIATEANHDEAITALAMAPRDQLLAEARGRLIELSLPGQPVSLTVHLPQPVQAMCFDIDGTRLFAASADGLVRCIDVASGRTLLTVRELPAPAKVIATAGNRDLIALLADGSAALLPASH